MEKKVQLVQKAHPEFDIEVWAIDEHRVGLKPVIRRTWVDEWTVPTAKVNWRFQWLWLYGFVHPKSGQTYWWILPYVNIQLFNKVLADFAQHFNIGRKKQVILVVDQAGWHTSDKVEVPQGIHLEFLPSHSPELQLIERWFQTVSCILSDFRDREKSKEHKRSQSVRPYNSNPLIKVCHATTMGFSLIVTHDKCFMRKFCKILRLYFASLVKF
ncbi:IS630 family transposase [Coleofasciculus sp. E2-BRE-01]|uniref:IS630 family transposase n=1 Tax=Coleofasciculus sp. E2-BRE-01 TaxID=3069524 RepID=UPI004063B55A